MGREVINCMEYGFYYKNCDVITEDFKIENIEDIG